MDEFQTWNLKPFLDNDNMFEVLHTKHLEQNINLFKSTITFAYTFRQYEQNEERKIGL